MNSTAKIRIAKRIAETRNYSRRQAEALIFKGSVTVNNQLINAPATLVSSTDVIAVDGVKLKFNSEPINLWLFNKPTGIITSKTDPQHRKTIYDILPPHLQNVLYVGRLDYNSEGLLLLTNSGLLVNELTLAKNQVPRIYKVKTFGKINQNDLNKLKNGITINGVRYHKIKAVIPQQSSQQSWIEFTLTEGKNNEIRKICEFFNLKVSKLIRTHYGDFALKNLAVGKIIPTPPTLLKQTLINYNIPLA